MIRTAAAAPVTFWHSKSNTKPVLGIGSAWARMYHKFMAEPDAFASSYHKRSNVETTFSMIEAKFGDATMSKSAVGQTNEVLCKILCHNICCLIQSHYELGIVPVFREDDPGPAGPAPALGWDDFADAMAWV